jgi:hypothetical protein
MADLWWCPTCEVWQEPDLPIIQIFAPRCEDCDSELEEEEGVKEVIIDHKDLGAIYPELRDHETEEGEDREDEEAEADTPDMDGEADSEADSGDY